MDVIMDIPHTGNTLQSLTQRRVQGVRIRDIDIFTYTYMSKGNKWQDDESIPMSCLRQSQSWFNTKTTEETHNATIAEGEDTSCFSCMNSSSTSL